MNGRSEKFIETSLAVVTALIGIFFTLGFIVLCIVNFRQGKADLAGQISPLIMVLVGYWFLKISYKIFKKSRYILTVTELKVSGLLFIVFPPLAFAVDYLQGRLSDPGRANLLVRLLPALVYGYWALRAAKARTASNQALRP